MRIETSAWFTATLLIVTAVIAFAQPMSTCIVSQVFPSQARIRCNKLQYDFQRRFFVLLLSYSKNNHRHIWDMAVIFRYLAAPLAGFEPTTNSLEGWCSVH